MSTDQIAAEEAELQSLYEAAQSEGGRLIVYAGGDATDQQAWTRMGFKEKFPAIDFQIIVDYSKFHDVRLDHQIEVGQIVPDVIQLQTLHDFDRWKAQGRIESYRPLGFDQVHAAFKDPDAAWVAIAVYAFSFFYDVNRTNGETMSVAGLTDPKWKGRIATAYPQDDDAALYLYKRYAETFGWDWVAAMAAQGMRFARGTNTPDLAVRDEGFAVGIGGAGSLYPAEGAERWHVASGDPFMAWGQRAAIVKGARNPSAARLYISWCLSIENQMKSFNGWTVREDVQPSPDIPPIWDYPNANVQGFIDFMADREQVEWWRQTFVLLFGEVTGAPSPGVSGLFPDKEPD